MERIKIKNPLTGQWIYQDGPTAKALQKQGIRLRYGPTKKVKPFQAPPTKASAPTKKYPVDTSDAPWGSKKPERVSERRELLKQCGKSCFMLPKELKFPVCNKKAPPCTYNKRGITAAYVRARQWGYEDVAAKVDRLRTTLGLHTTAKKK